MRKDALLLESDYGPQDKVAAELIKNLDQDLIYQVKQRINEGWNLGISENTTERLNQILKENKLPQKLNTETFKVRFSNKIISLFLRMFF